MSRCYKLLVRSPEANSLHCIIEHEYMARGSLHFLRVQLQQNMTVFGFQLGLHHWGRSHIAPKNAWKTLGALLSPFFQSTRAVALRRRLSLLSNNQLRSPLQEGNFVTWPAVRLRHSEKLRCIYLDAARTRLEKTSASHRDCVASIMSAHTARLHLK